MAEHTAAVAGEEADGSDQWSDAAADGGAGTGLDMGSTDPSLLRGLGGVVLVFVLGSLFGYNWAWIRNEPDVPPLETGLAIGGFYAILLGGGLACARIYHRVRPPGSPPSGLAEVAGSAQRGH